MIGAMPLFDLSGRTALVTGSSRGLGLAMATGLADAGATIILNARDPAALDAAAAPLRARGATVHVAAFDVTDEAAIQASLEPHLAAGPIDILVNNAGLQRRAPFAEQPREAWTAMFETHVFGAVKLVQAVTPSMIARGRGKIINICSLMSEVARPSVAPYAAAKGALKMLTKAMAIELAPHNIQVNGIGPGYFATELNAALIADATFDAFVRKRTPAGRWGEPAELAGAAVFLAADASNFVTGQIVYVDGGILASL
jgi:gluconate 5-dehydrogenase